MSGDLTRTLSDAQIYQIINGSKEFRRLSETFTTHLTPPVMPEARSIRRLRQVDVAKAARDECARCASGPRPPSYARPHPHLTPEGGFCQSVPMSRPIWLAMERQSGA